MDDGALAPAGIGLIADPALRRIEGGEVLIGGAPLRVIRLSARGAAVVDAWLGGTPLADVKSARRLARRLLDAGMVHPVVAPTVARDVTLVVPCRDDPARLDRCLAAAVGRPAVVVDDASADPDAVAAVAARHGARVVRRDVNGGPGVARNDGLALADTAIVAFVDTDVEAPPGWLDDLIAHFADPAVVAVAPRVRSRDGTSLLDRYERAHSPLDLGPTPAIVGPGRPVGHVPSAALVVRRAAVTEQGGFDPALRVGEDVDLVWRLVAAGGTVRYEPAVEVTHEPRESWPAWLRQRWSYGTSAAPLGVRHGADIAPARCSPWSALAWAAVGAGRPATGLAVAAASSAALVPKLEGLRDPIREAATIAGGGHLHAGRGLARAVARVWWPIALLVGLLWRRSRPALAVALAGPHLADWVAGARPAGAAPTVALRVLDDAAYGAGVWTGVVRTGDLTALRPDLGEWPGRRPAIEADTVT